MLTWLKDYGPAIGALTGALIAFIAVLQLVVVGPMNQRFDQQDKRTSMPASDAEMDQRFDQQDRYVNTRFDAVDQRFNQQDERLDLLTNEVAELRKLTISIVERVSRHDGQIEFLMQQLQAVDVPAP